MASTARKRVKGEARRSSVSDQDANDEEPSSRRNSVDVPSKPAKEAASPPVVSPSRLFIKAALLLLSFTCFTLAVLPFLQYRGETSHVSFDQPSANLQQPGSASAPAPPPPPPPPPYPRTRRPNKGGYTSPLPFPIDARPLPVEAVREADRPKQEAIREAFRDSWGAYVEDAFGSDEYHPISRRGSNFSVDGGVGYFIIDTLDVLLIMGETDEYQRARDWVRDLDWSKRRGKFSVFETTIRTLGGLLSAHALCTEGQDTLSSRTSTLCSAGDAEMFLQKAIMLAQSLKPAFQENKLGIPMREIDFQTGRTFADVDNRNYSSLAEVASIQLEFKYLAHLTGEVDWWTLAERPMQAVAKTSRKARSEGLLPIFLEPISGESVLSSIRLGSRGDSYYEYLLKQYLQTNHSESVYGVMYRRASTSIKRRLLAQSPKRKLLYTFEIEPRVSPESRQPRFFSIPKQDHLVCFLGGNYMLGAIHIPGDEVPSSYRPSDAQQGNDDGEEDEHNLHGDGSRAKYPLDSFDQLSPHAQEDWTVGHELIKTCVDTYTGTRTGLAAEITMFRNFNDGYRGSEPDWYIKRGSPFSPIIDSRNILRPETVESLFVAFHLTGDEVYRRWGWQIFQAFVRVTRIKEGDKGRVGAFSGIKDVQQEFAPNSKKKREREDRMETFWLAETLKYLYLLFSDQDTLRLDQWVLNTEAHPLPIFQPKFATTVV